MQKESFRNSLAYEYELRFTQTERKREGRSSAVRDVNDAFEASNIAGVFAGFQFFSRPDGLSRAIARGYAFYRGAAFSLQRRV